MKRAIIIQPIGFSTWAGVMSPAASKVYDMLLKIQYEDSTLAKLAEVCDMSRNKCRRALQELQHHDIITIEEVE